MMPRRFQCGERGPAGVPCTRQRGHDGRHLGGVPPSSWLDPPAERFGVNMAASADRFDVEVSGGIELPGVRLVIRQQPVDEPARMLEVICTPGQAEHIADLLRYGARRQRAKAGESDE